MTADDHALAAELALGLLEGSERVDALARARDDAEFAHQIAWWRERFAGLFDDYGTAVPHDLVAARIAAAADGRHLLEARTRWPWVLGGAATGALAASLAFIALIPRAVPGPASPPAAPSMLAAAVVPATGTDGTAMPIIVDAAAHTIRIASSPVVPDRRAAELWRIGADGVPRSLGILHATGTTRLRITVSLRAGDTLAISIEPPHGSPSGSPTGPVVATGKLVGA